jgi:hypothetical protein
MTVLPKHFDTAVCKTLHIAPQRLTTFCQALPARPTKEA